VEALRAALDARRWPPFPLTAKLLENALEGSVPTPQQPGATQCLEHLQATCIQLTC